MNNIVRSFNPLHIGDVVTNIQKDRIDPEKKYVVIEKKIETILLKNNNDFSDDNYITVHVNILKELSELWLIDSSKIKLSGTLYVDTSGEKKFVYNKDYLPDKYDLCSELDLNIFQKLIVNQVKHNHNNVKKGFPRYSTTDSRSSFARLTNNIDKYIKSGTIVAITAYIQGYIPFYFVDIYQKYKDIQINYRKIYKKEDDDSKLKEFMSSIELVEDPGDLLLNSYTDDNLTATLNNIPVGSVVKVIDTDTLTENYMGYVVHIGKQVGEKITLFNPNHPKMSTYEITANMYLLSNNNYYITKFCKEGTTGENIIYKHLLNIKGGDIIQSKKEPDIKGYIQYAKTYNKDIPHAKIDVMWKDTKKNVNFSSENDITTFRTSDYEIVDHDESYNTYYSQKPVGQCVKEFTGLVPGALIRFLSDFKLKSDCVAKEGQTGYIIECPNDSTYDQRHVNIVIKDANSYISHVVKFLDITQRPYVTIERFTNIKDPSVFSRAVDLEKDIQLNENNFYTYPYFYNFVNKVINNPTDWPEIGKKFIPHYGIVKFYSKEEFLNLIIPVYVKYFFKVNNLNLLAIEYISNKYNVFEIFKSDVLTDSNIVARASRNFNLRIAEFFMPHDTKVKLHMKQDSPKLKIGCKDEMLCRVVRYGSTLESIELQLIDPDSPNHAKRFCVQIFDLCRFDIEIVDNRTEEEKTSLSGMNRLSDPDSNSNTNNSFKDLVFMWRDDYLKFIGEEPGEAKYKYPEIEEVEYEEVFEWGDYTGKEYDELSVDAPKTNEEYEYLYGDMMYYNFCEENGLYYVNCSHSMKNKNVLALIKFFIDEYQETIGFRDIDDIVSDIIYDRNY